MGWLWSLVMSKTVRNKCLVFLFADLNRVVIIGSRGVGKRMWRQPCTRFNTGHDGRSGGGGQRSPKNQSLITFTFLVDSFAPQKEHFRHLFSLPVLAFHKPRKVLKSGGQTTGAFTLTVVAPARSRAPCRWNLSSLWVFTCHYSPLFGRCSLTPICQ